MKKTKVVHIVPMLGPGGAERIAVDIVVGLDRQKFDVAVISIWRRVGCELESFLDNFGVRVEYLGKGWGFDGRTYHRLHRVLRELHPDVVHTHLHVLRYALPSLLLLKPAGVVHTVHNLAERETETRARCIQRYALNHGIVPVAVSEEVAISLNQLYGIRQCRVIPNGISQHRYANPQTARSKWRAREGFRDDQILFVCVARFAEQKNHALLLKAFAQGPASDPNAHLVLVGEGGLQEQLESQAEDLGVSRQVHFLGLRTDIPDVLGATDVFVLSSAWEGNPLSMMEAMAAGLPIVSTAVGGVPDLIANGREGFLVPPGDVKGFSGAMTFLLRDRETRRSMGTAAAQRAKENFDVSKMVRAYEQLYENLIDHMHRSRTETASHTQDATLQEA